ncbi:unnamed protein product, partial [Didymodactylos carnosus]
VLIGLGENTLKVNDLETEQLLTSITSAAITTFSGASPTTATTNLIRYTLDLLIKNKIDMKLFCDKYWKNFERTNDQEILKLKKFFTELVFESKSIVLIEHLAESIKRQVSYKSELNDLLVNLGKRTIVNENDPLCASMCSIIGQLVVTDILQVR